MELIPKKTPELPYWLNILFYASLVLLIFSIISFFVLNHSIKKSQKTTEDLKESLIRIETPENLGLEKEILNYQKKIEDFPGLAKQHLETSKVFEFLQRVCHPRVMFSQFGLDARQGTLLLSGETQSFESLGQQYLIFKGESLIQNVDIEKISINKRGKVEFTFSISLDPKIFQPR